MNLDALAVGLLIGAFAVTFFGLAAAYAPYAFLDKGDPLLPRPVAIVIVIVLIMLGISFTIGAVTSYNDIANPQSIYYNGANK